nr:MFS transporter [Corynebacterium striatum]
MSAPNPREVVTTKALSIWVAAMLVYIVAITGRTSFGVAGLEAMASFDVDASRIAVFTSVQLGIYAFAQIPTGMLIDKYGPRKLLVIGAVIMGVGQVALGLTTNYWMAIAARLLIGAGDATAFLSVMRILPYWFPLHRTPMFTQVTSSLGQLGQFVSAIPFAALLGWTGWTTAFVALGAAGILIALAAAVAVADTPEALGIIETPAEQPNSQAHSLAASLAMVLRSPVAWQGFFIHFCGLLGATVFVMLWGMPFMTEGLGISKMQAGTVLTFYTICMIYDLHDCVRANSRQDFLARTGFPRLDGTVFHDTQHNVVDGFLPLGQQLLQPFHPHGGYFLVLAVLELWLRHRAREHGTQRGGHGNRLGQHGWIHLFDGGSANFWHGAR